MEAWVICSMHRCAWKENSEVELPFFGVLRSRTGCLKIENFPHASTLPCLLGFTVLGPKESMKVWKRPRLQSVGRVVSNKELLLPSFSYYIDESDPDIVILR